MAFLRVIAGPGTGKTRFIIERALSMMPAKILILTFTNKAAGEIHERLGQKAASVKACTFHSCAARILRNFWNANFRIIDEKERENIIKTRPLLDDELGFDDLLTKLLWLWRESPEVLKKCQDQFDHVMVDEYQDVNPQQVEIVKKLVPPHGGLCVVGDPDQTIYSWRGSDPLVMEKFLHDFPKTSTVVLTKNYRNPPNILKAAENLISKNTARIPVPLVPVSDSKEKIVLWESSISEEGIAQLKQVLEGLFGSSGHMHDADSLDRDHKTFRPFSDIAILYRMNEQGRRLKSVLEKEGYPVQISSPENFWSKKIVVSFLETLRNSAQTALAPEFYGLVPSCTPGLVPSCTWNLVAAPPFASSAASQAPQLSTACLASAFPQYLQSRIREFSASAKLSVPEEQDLLQLLPHCFHHETVSSFLDEAKLMQEQDNLLPADRINLLTFHAAKGLEFPIVLVVGLEEGKMPPKNAENLEEERRLLYVGMTRAKEQLHLFYDKNASSRFLQEMMMPDGFERQELHPKNLRHLLRKKAKKEQIRMF